MYTPQKDIDRGRAIIGAAERELGPLTQGQRRDLLCDNTEWDWDHVARVVDHVANAANLAARALIERLDNITTEEFALGAESIERYALRQALGLAPDDRAAPDSRRVRIEVSGGIADVTACPAGVDVEILDHDDAAEEASYGPRYDEEGQPICSDPGGHVWPRNIEEHERCLCIHCGADGDA